MSSTSFKGGEAEDEKIPSETKPSKSDNPLANHTDPPTSPSQAAFHGVDQHQLKQVAARDLLKQKQPPAPNVEKQEKDEQSLSLNPDHIYTAYPENYEAQPDPPQPHPPNDTHDQSESDEGCCRKYCCCIF
ncbi:hypothetical protein V6N13_121183 [Hibiscus sabdariffa]|uniref:Uncharacterized protein n=2 Tax=Hibiscus sabdariffa TaxID=183260 RepID=A0ABR2A423_9ROSI